MIELLLKGAAMGERADTKRRVEGRERRVEEEGEGGGGVSATAMGASV